MSRSRNCRWWFVFLILFSYKTTFSNILLPISIWFFCLSINVFQYSVYLIYYINFKFLLSDINYEIVNTSSSNDPVRVYILDECTRKELGFDIPLFIMLMMVMMMKQLKKKTPETSVVDLKFVLWNRKRTASSGTIVMNEWQDSRVSGFVDLSLLHYFGDLIRIILRRVSDKKRMWLNKYSRPLENTYFFLF